MTDNNNSSPTPVRSGFKVTLGVLLALIFVFCLCSGLVVSCVAAVGSQGSP